jgi:hypothetical protein
MPRLTIFRSYPVFASLFLSMLLAFSTSACDSNGPEACGSDPLATGVETGEWTAQVRQGSECELWEGDDAHFNFFNRAPLRDAPHFYAELTVSGGAGPRLHFALLANKLDEKIYLDEKSHDVADLPNSEYNAIATIEEKAGMGGVRLAGYRALSKSGTITVETSEPNVVAVSFEVTLAPYDDLNEPIRDSSEEIYVSGRFNAERDDDQKWIIF